VSRVKEAASLGRARGHACRTAETLFPSSTECAGHYGGMKTTWNLMWLEILMVAGVTPTAFVEPTRGPPLDTGRDVHSLAAVAHSFLGEQFILRRLFSGGLQGCSAAKSSPSAPRASVGT